MTTMKRGEDAASYLQVVATPKLYLNNAFRVTGLEVTASLKEAKKRVRDREQSQKFGIPWKFTSRPYFPTLRTQTIDDIRIAVDQSLANPYNRIIEELFWFWPDPEGDPDDEALDLLRQGHWRKASGVWISHLNSHQANVVPLHNLAVLNHIQALELEQEIREGRCQNLVCPKCRGYLRIIGGDCGTVIDCPNCAVQLRTPPPSLTPPSAEFLAQLWRDALEYWSRLWISAPFWTEFSLRAQKIDEILGRDAIDQIKNRLPEALLSINVGLAIDYCRQQSLMNATRQAQVVFSSKFSEKHQLSAVRAATAQLISQVHEQAELAENDANARPESGVQAALNLLERTRPTLKCLEILNFGSVNLGHAACDSVANSVLKALVAYEKKSHDCKPLLEPAKEILGIAKSESLRQRISDNLDAIQNNIRREVRDEHIRSVIILCEQLSQAISTMPDSDRSMPYHYYRRFRDDVLPMLEGIRRQYGDSSEEYAEASNASAYCLRGISVALHNNSQDVQSALAAIQSAVGLAKDRELRVLLAKDLEICRQHANNQAPESLARTLARIANPFGSSSIPAGLSEKVKWIIAAIVGIAILVALAKSCGESSNSDYSGSTASTHQTHTYTPPSSPEYKTSIPNQTEFQIRGSPSGYRPSSVIPTPSSNTNSSRPSIESLLRSRLRQEIEAGKEQLKAMETQLEEMDKQLENYKSQADRYKLFDMIDEYNNLVPTYNALVGRRRHLYSQYDSLYNDIDKKIDRYNAGGY